MKRAWILLIAALAAWTQVAEHANKGLRTEEGRKEMLGTLSAPARVERLQAAKLAQSLGLKKGDTVVDLGTGAGMLLPFLSEAVGPAGKVIAEEITEEFLDKARENAGQHGLKNVEFVLGSEKDPNLPVDGVDLVVAVDTYHHFNYPAEMLAAIRNALRPGGKFVVVDYYKKGFRDPEHIRLEKQDAIKEIEGNGFRLTTNSEHIPESQYRLDFVEQ
jgi:ubiquinone/menaquinone biosynthesis C-methylase UbiE